MLPATCCFHTLFTITTLYSALWPSFSTAHIVGVLNLFMSCTVTILSSTLNKIYVFMFINIFVFLFIVLQNTCFSLYSYKWKLISYNWFSKANAKRKNCSINQWKKIKKKKEKIISLHKHVLKLNVAQHVA